MQGIVRDYSKLPLVGCETSTEIKADVRLSVSSESKKTQVCFQSCLDCEIQTRVRVPDSSQDISIDLPGALLANKTLLIK